MKPTKLVWHFLATELDPTVSTCFGQSTHLRGGAYIDSADSLILTGQTVSFFVYLNRYVSQAGLGACINDEEGYQRRQKSIEIELKMVALSFPQNLLSSLQFQESCKQF